MEQSFKLVAVGFVVGILSGMLGLGGGVFMVPIMVTYFAVAQHNAHATSLAVIIPTAVASAVVYGFHGSIDYAVTVNLVIGSMIGAKIGAKLAMKLPAAQLKKLFGIMLVLVGIRMVIA
jgi:hypothetical protein